MAKSRERHGSAQDGDVTPDKHSGTEEGGDSDTLPLVADKQPCFPARYTLAVFGFLGFVNVYCMQVNLSVAMVAMTSSNSSSTNQSDECPLSNDGNSSDSSTGEFDWSEATQGYILGSFFYGYIVTQIPGGYLASRIGGKKLFGFGVLCTAVLTLMTPLAAWSSVGVFIAVRVLEGLGEGVTFPAMHAIWGQWAPVMERSKLVSFTYAGAQLGTVIALPISGVLCDSDFLGGWPSVFYVFGALGCIWFVVWMLFTHDTPAQHPRITQAERRYIESSLGTQLKATGPTPWRHILTSLPVLAICIAHFTNNWGFYTLLTTLPSYMKNILHFNVKENGFLSALPYVVSWLLQSTAGLMADAIRTRQYMSTRNVRKLFTTVGLILPAVFLILVGYVGCDHTWAVVCLTLSVGLGGFIMGGFISNHLDLSPAYAGVLMGVSNCVATIPGFAGPALVGLLTDNNDTRGQWRIVFYVASGIYVVGTCLYLILAKGEEQEWSRGEVTTLTVKPEGQGIQESVIREA